MDAGDKLAVLASSKLRKSFFFLQLALAMAAGREFLGWRIPRPRRVVYVQFEVREHHTHRRLRNIARAMGITRRRHRGPPDDHPGAWPGAQGC